MTAPRAGAAGDASLHAKLFAAVDRLGRAVRIARQRIATQEGVSILQLQLVECLARRGSLRVGELADELAVRQPTVSDAVSALTAKGVADRQADAADGRSTVVSLTPYGHELAERVAAALGPLHEARSDDAAGTRAAALRVLLEEITRLQEAGLITMNRSCLSCRHYLAAEAGSEARCLLLEQPLRPPDLRVDCPEHAPLP